MTIQGRNKFHCPGIKPIGNTIKSPNIDVDIARDKLEVEPPLPIK